MCSSDLFGGIMGRLLKIRAAPRVPHLLLEAFPGAPALRRMMGGGDEDEDEDFLEDVSRDLSNTGFNQREDNYVPPVVEVGDGPSQPLGPTTPLPGGTIRSEEGGGDSKDSQDQNPGRRGAGWLTWPVSHLDDRRNIVILPPVEAGVREVSGHVLEEVFIFILVSPPHHAPKRGGTWECF